MGDDRQESSEQRFVEPLPVLVSDDTPGREVTKPDPIIVDSSHYSGSSGVLVEETPDVIDAEVVGYWDDVTTISGKALTGALQAGLQRIIFFDRGQDE